MGVPINEKSSKPGIARIVALRDVGGSVVHVLRDPLRVRAVGQMIMTMHRRVERALDRSHGSVLVAPNRICGTWSALISGLRHHRGLHDGPVALAASKSDTWDPKRDSTTPIHRSRGLRRSDALSPIAIASRARNAVKLSFCICGASHERRTVFSPYPGAHKSLLDWIRRLLMRVMRLTRGRGHKSFPSRAPPRTSSTMFRLSALVLSAVLLGLSFSGSRAATCTRPSVRREWRKLSAPERAEWIAAINCLARLPHDDALTPIVDRSISNIPPVNTSGSYWDDIVYIHMDLNTRIHSTGFFFPFHRFYVHAVESAMTERCGYTGAFPYWDWSIDAHDVEHSPLFEDSNPISGLGGWGDPAKDIQVQTGGFRHLEVAYPVPHVLRRNFTLQPFLPFASVPVFTAPEQYANVSFTPERVRALVDWTPGDFVGFQFAMEFPEGPHASVHFILGGDLAGQCPLGSPPDCFPQPTFSANEPVFFLHHAMVDKVWSDWQHKHASNFWAYEGGSVQNITSLQALHDFPNGMAPALSLDSVIPADGMFPEVTIRDVMDTTGGYLCYVYE